jgi:hypothetical protein
VNDRSLFLPLAATLLVAAGGCAPLRWDKPGADAAALERDLEQCRQIARAEAARRAWPFKLTAARVIGFDRGGRPIVVQPFPHETERFLEEHDLARACMRGKGYALVPAQPEPARER